MTAPPREPVDVPQRVCELMLYATKGMSAEDKITPDYNQHTPWPAKHEPTGTNLFTVEQARAMFEHCLEGSTLQESRDAAVRLWNDTGEDLLAAQGALVRILNAIAGADIPINLSPESQELVHACTQARRVLAASGEAIVKGGSNVL